MSLEDNNNSVDKMFKPTRLGWLGLTRQRMRSGKYQESPEVVSKFKEMIAIRDNLKKIESCMVNWDKAMKKLHIAAQKLGAAVETDPELKKDGEWGAELHMKDKSALDSVREKIRRINHLLAQRETLKFIKLKGEYAEHRLERIRKHEKSESYDKQSQKYLSIKKESANQREQIIAQVTLVIDKLVKDTAENGVAVLIAAQLRNFKLSQFHLFLSFQKIIQGKKEEIHLNEIEEHYKNIQAELAEAKESERASTIQSADWLEGVELQSEASELSEPVGGGNKSTRRAKAAMDKAKLEATKAHADIEAENGKERSRVPSILASSVGKDDIVNDHKSDFEGDDISETGGPENEDM